MKKKYIDSKINIEKISPNIYKIRKKYLLSLKVP